MIQRCSLIIGVWLVIGFNLNATTYYVSKTGQDTNSGSEDEPFLTIAAASAVLVAGDTCYIKEGTYRETLSPVSNGTAENPICYMAYGSDSVTVSAVNEVVGWTVHDGTIYKADLTMSLGVERRMLYFNGNAMDIARWPDNADNDPYTVDTKYVSGGGASYITYSGIPDIDWAGGYIWYLGAHSGASWTRPISSSSTMQINFSAIDINSWPFDPHNPTIVRNNHRGIFYLFGKLAALNTEREWYYDASLNRIYFKAPGGVSPATGVVEYAARENSMNINRNYVYVEGINAFGGMVAVSGDNCVVKNGRFMHCLQRLDELDNTDAQIGEGAVNITGSNVLIENNWIVGSASNGIALLASWAGSQNNTIQNNVITQVNTIGNHSCGIRSNCPGTILQKNTVFTCGRDGMYVSGNNGDISYNNVYDCMKINNDGGVFYTVGNADSKNTVIHHNWFHDSWGPEYADGRAAGIYLDNNSKGYEVHHNVVWNVTWAAIQINWDNWYIDIVNNTLWEVEGAMGRWENGYTIDDINVVNNYASSGEWIGTNIQNNLIDSEDQFVFLNGDNFLPSEGSALVDGGIEYGMYTAGYVGSAPDLGAYERGGDRWLAGADWISTDSLTLPIFLNNSEEQIIIYPNPSYGEIHVDLGDMTAPHVTIAVYNMSGEPVYVEHTTNLSSGSKVRTIQQEIFNKGLYIINVYTTGKVFTSKVIIM